MNGMGEAKESEEQKAERFIGTMLSEWRWMEADLRQRRKGDKYKVRAE